VVNFAIGVAGAVVGALVSLLSQKVAGTLEEKYDTGRALSNMVGLFVTYVPCIGIAHAILERDHFSVFVVMLITGAIVAACLSAWRAFKL
jgi:fluoride ion exporter CrcB/FEX